MFGFLDYQAKREHYEDLLREAEKERLISQLFTRESGPSMLERLRDFLADKLEAVKYSELVMRLRNA